MGLHQNKTGSRILSHFEEYQSDIKLPPIPVWLNHGCHLFTFDRCGLQPNFGEAKALLVILSSVITSMNIPFLRGWWWVKNLWQVSFQASKFFDWTNDFNKKLQWTCGSKCILGYDVVQSDHPPVNSSIPCPEQKIEKCQSWIHCHFRARFFKVRFSLRKWDSWTKSTKSKTVPFGTGWNPTILTLQIGSGGKIWDSLAGSSWVKNPLVNDQSRETLK